MNDKSKYMKRTCLSKNTNTNGFPMYIGTCEFHQAENLSMDQLSDPKDIQQVRSFARMKNVCVGFIIILIVLGFTGCGFFSTIPIDPDKIPLLTKGDKLIFKSDSTVNYFNVEIAGITGSYEGESEYMHEIYTTKCVQIRNDDSAFIFRAIIRDDVYWLTIRGANTFYEDINVGYMSDSLQIGDYLLKNLYKSSEHNFMMILDLGISIIAFKYSLKYGIVEYELSNGEIFRLDESCIEKMNNKQIKAVKPND